MKEKSAQLEFEDAAKLRDEIKRLEMLDLEVREAWFIVREHASRSKSSFMFHDTYQYSDLMIGFELRGELCPHFLFMIQSN